MPDPDPNPNPNPYLESVILAPMKCERKDSVDRINIHMAY